MPTPDCHTFRPEPLNTTVASFGSVFIVFWQESTNHMLKQYKNTEKPAGNTLPGFDVQSVWLDLRLESFSEGCNGLF